MLARPSHVRKSILLIIVAMLCACSPVSGDEAQVSILFTAAELRAVIVATEYGPFSSQFTDNADMRRALESARQKMIGVSAATR